MNYIKKAIYGPDPREQKRKCDQLINRNQRELDKQLRSLKTTETKTKRMIQQCARRNDIKSARLLAKEIVKAQKHRESLLKSKAQLGSIQMQVGEAFALQKLQGSMATSTKLMREVNQLVKLPELMGTMQQLGQELIKSGIIDEMVTDTLDTAVEASALEDGEEEEQQVNHILSEILDGGNKQKETKRPAEPVQHEEEVDEEEDEEAINDMRERLKALQT